MKFHSLLRWVVALACLAATMTQADHLVYFGTYTGAKSKGIYAFLMSDDGKLTPLGLAADAAPRAKR